MKTSYEKFMASTAVKVELGGVKVELGKLDNLKTELADNIKELNNIMSALAQLKARSSYLRDSYAYISGQFSSMNNIASELGDSKLTDDIVKSLNASNDGYKKINDLYQKFK
jgi:hypothetical protein